MTIDVLNGSGSKLKIQELNPVGLGIFSLLLALDPAHFSRLKSVILERRSKNIPASFVFDREFRRSPRRHWPAHG